MPKDPDNSTDTPKIEVAKGYKGARIPLSELAYRKLMADPMPLAEKLKDPNNLDLYLQYNPNYVVLTQPNIPLTHSMAYTRMVVNGTQGFDLREALDNREAVYAAQGYSSQAFNNYAGYLRSQHFINGKWAETKYQKLYEHIGELSVLQSEWETQHKGTATMLDQYHQKIGTSGANLPLDENGNPLLFGDPQKGEPTILPLEYRQANASYFLKDVGEDQMGYDQYLRLQAQNQPLDFHYNNATNQLTVGPSATIANIKSVAASGTQYLAKQGLKKIGSKAATQLSRQALTKGATSAAAAAAGAPTGGLGTFMVIAGSWLLGYLNRYRKQLAALFAYLSLQLLLFLKTILSSAAALATTGLGAIAGGLFGGPIGAILGGSIGGFLGYTISNFLSNTFGGTTQAAGHATHAAITGTAQTTNVNLATGQITHISTRAVGVADIFTGFTPGTAFLLTSVVGPFVLAGVLTWLTMTHLLVAFSVPNPQDPEFGNSSSRYPWSPGVSRGTPLPPGTVPIPTLAPDITGPTAELLVDAADAACLPVTLLNAFVTVETGATNLDASFDEDGWWLTAGPTGGDCYDTPTRGGTSELCREGFCYDNGFRVWGITQFWTPTFYGCDDPDGLMPDGSINVNCNSGVVPYIRDMRGLPDTYMPNRCRSGDAMYAAAAKLSRDSGQTPGSCEMDNNRWTTERICTMARAYCGSCGEIVYNPSALPVEDQPCLPYYTQTVSRESSKACGALGTSREIGYCNLIYNYYVGG